MDLISIVVPIYNVEKYLRKCLESIINQTYKNLEIILVDDGSPDKCGEICDDFEKIDKRIKVIHKKNGGLSDARNCGLEIAIGKYMCFIDSDDYIELDMVEKLYKAICKENADISICGMMIEYEDGRKINKTKKNNYKKIMDKMSGLKMLNSFYLFDMATCDKMFKTELFGNDIRYPIGKKSEDFYTTYKLFFKANKSIYIPEALYHYYQRENSISRNKNNIDRAYIDGSIDQLNFFKKEIPSLVYIAESTYAFANIAYYNNYLDYNIKISHLKKKQLKEEVKKYLKSIINNDVISKVKKIQSFIFVYCLILYDLLYRIKK
ncbi:MAG: glycosyltransferase family 2 protein [Bacilli bacterium]|nr:glycosyltransferase family 2 protein [Bacilli bacterium]